MALTDRNGQRLFPGDKVIASYGLKDGPRTFVVRGPIELTGTRFEKVLMTAQIKAMGYSLYEIADLVELGWYPCKYLERVGTTLEPAKKSFNEIMTEIAQ